MKDRERSPVDATRCALCGEANDCALARRGAGASGVGAACGEPAGAGSEAPCWCRPRRFPPELLALARARDGGAACVCRRCLDEALARGD